MSRKQGAGKKPAKDGFSQLSQLVAQGRHDAVVAAASQWLRLHPPHPFVLKVLAVGLMGLNRHTEAEPILAKALALAPKDAELHSNLGICRAAAGSHAAAVEAFSQALKFSPSDHELWKNQGTALFLLGRWNEAVQSLMRAIELQDVDDDIAIRLLANSLMNAQRYDEAFACFSLLVQDQPDHAEYCGSLLALKLRRADWDDLSAALERFRMSGSFSVPGAMEPLHALSMPGITLQEAQEAASARVRHELPVYPDAISRSGGPGARLRIGYLSADFRHHAVAYLLPDILARHDRAKFDVVAYSIGRNDQSAIRQRVERAVDRFCDLTALSDLECAEAIAADGIDVLVDLQGWTTGARPGVLARRPAEAIVNWLGYPGTMGDVRLADYLIADAVAVPAAHEAFYVEKILRMPDSYLPLDATGGDVPLGSRRDAGLPESGFLFGSLNDAYKINPEVFDVWCDIMHKIPDSYLLLRAGSDPVMASLRAAAEARNVSAGRLLFQGYVADHDEFIARLALTDLMLDPFPYNSHSTGMWSLWAGVPMVSLLGQTFAGRVGASLLSAAGLHECIARNPNEYKEISVSLAQDQERLSAMRRHLERGHRTLPLFDMERFTRELEQRLVEAVQVAAAV